MRLMRVRVVMKRAMSICESDGVSEEGCGGRRGRTAKATTVTRKAKKAKRLPRIPVTRCDPAAKRRAKRVRPAAMGWRMRASGQRRVSERAARAAKKDAQVRPFMTVPAMLAAPLSLSEIKSRSLQGAGSAEFLSRVPSGERTHYPRLALVQSPA